MIAPDAYSDGSLCLICDAPVQAQVRIFWEERGRPARCYSCTMD